MKRLLFLILFLAPFLSAQTPYPFNYGISTDSIQSKNTGAVRMKDSLVIGSLKSPYSVKTWIEGITGSKNGFYAGVPGSTVGGLRLYSSTDNFFANLQRGSALPGNLTLRFPVAQGTHDIATLQQSPQSFTGVNSFSDAVLFYGSTDSIKILPGTATSVDRLDFFSQTTNRGMNLNVIPNGTSTLGKISVANQASGTDFSDFAFQVQDSTASLMAKDNGTPAIPIRHLVVGGTSPNKAWTDITLGQTAGVLGTTIFYSGINNFDSTNTRIMQFGGNATYTKQNFTLSANSTGKDTLHMILSGGDGITNRGGAIYLYGDSYPSVDSGRAYIISGAGGGHKRTIEIRPGGDDSKFVFDSAAFNMTGVNLKTNADLITSNNNYVRAGTSDGSDNQSVGINGGGAVATTRGARITVFGNQFASSDSGKVAIISGTDNGFIRNVDIRPGGTTRFSADSNGVNVTGQVTLTGNEVFSSTSFTVLANTTDGSDNKRMLLNGGGAVAQSRGGRVEIYGNEFASTDSGSVKVLLGSVTAPTFTVLDATGKTMVWNAAGLTISSLGTFNGGVSAGGAASATTRLTVRNGLLANIAEFYNSSGVLKAKVDSVGKGTFDSLVTKRIILQPDLVSGAIEMGRIRWDSTQRAFYGTQYLVERSFAMNHNVHTDTLYVSGTTNETDIDTVIMGANYPAASKIVETRMQGIYNASAGGSKTFIFRVRKAGVLVDSVTVTTPAGGSSTEPIELVHTLGFRSSGASSTISSDMKITSENGVKMNSKTLYGVSTLTANLFIISVQISDSGAGNDFMRRTAFTTTVQ